MTSFNQEFPQAIYTQRRNRVAESILKKSGGGVLVINTAEEKYRNRDSDFPYRHDSDFYYLTGFDEPGATLVMIVNSSKTETILFCRPKDLDREIWDGWRLGPEAAPQYLGINCAFSNTQLDEKMPGYLANQNAIFSRLINAEPINSQLKKWLNEVKGMARTGANSPAALFDAETIIHEMRLFKDQHEINTMRQAG
ncbi:MAG: hypothetical protein RLZZ619_110, partial [Pseudomonadota bacterium]